LGLGMPWVLAAIYHESNGSQFKVHAGDLGFSVTVYTAVAVIALALILVRRYVAFFGKAELGGPTGAKWASGIFMFTLWFVYVIVSSLQAYGHIKI